MPSTPFICCSSGEATVSAMTFGLAPGNAARTTTVGGTTPGNSLIGSWKSASSPPTTISSERTIAKIGRVMKKDENFIGHRPSARPSHSTSHAGTDALQAVDDDQLAGVQARSDDTQAVDDRAERDRP